jgi:hypothetical protein
MSEKSSKSACQARQEYVLVEDRDQVPRALALLGGEEGG